MKFSIWGPVPTRIDATQADRIAFALRLGLGSVFVIGGWWKLSRALDPERAGALVERYTASNGYINAFFDQYLFAGPDALLTPLVFLILLSAFELLSGLAFLAGVFVRALSFVYAFLLWSFVIALPVVTAPGVETAAASYFSPAILVQIRDIGLSGMCFVLFCLGSGAWSVDQRVLNRGAAPEEADWNVHGLLLRLSVAAVFIVGGFFAGFDHIKSFVDSAVLLAVIGLVLASGHATRIAAAAAFAAVAWYCVGKMSLDATLWDNLNAIKRELAYLAACGVLFAWQGGRGFRLDGLVKAPRDAVLGKVPRDAALGKAQRA